MLRLTRLSLFCAVLLAACSDTGVEPPTVTSLQIAPDSVLLTAIDDVVRLRATVTNARGASIATPITWQSDRTDVAAVDAHGVVTARGAGTARITANAEGQTATATVTVRQRVAELRNVRPSGLLRPGDRVALQITAFDARGNPVNGVRVAWELSHPQSMSIDSAGVVLFKQVGSFWARATVDGASTNFQFGVVDQFETISAGGRITCGRTSGLDVYCWGLGFTIPSPEIIDFAEVYGNPTLIAGSAGAIRFTQISAGDVHACGVATDTSLYCWGDARFTGTGAGGQTARRVGEYRFVSASAARTCALNASGEVLCWSAAGAPARVASSAMFATISVGVTHACGLTASGEAWCWGENESGQLGLGRFDDVPVATPVAVNTELRFSQISVGDRHTCAVTFNDFLHCWGNDRWGQTGLGTSATPCVSDGLAADCVLLPAQVSLPAPVEMVTTGAEHTCAVLSNGTAYCWGNARNGRTGNRVTELALRPVQLPYPGWSRLSAGATHTCGFIEQMRGLVCFGSNTWGQLPFGWIGGEYGDPGGSFYHRLPGS